MILRKNANGKMTRIKIKVVFAEEERFESSYSEEQIKKIIKLQALFRGILYRKNHLPLIMYEIQSFIKKSKFSFSRENEDGRVNSCIDEDSIINLLKIKYEKRIKQPQKRMWYDILILDYRHGWLPVNIKTTTTLTSDNTGNLAMCVYAYTNHQLDTENFYGNGSMSKVLIKKIKNKEYNTIHKKDYYFLVLNKNESSDVIVNSVKGLSKLTPNINNLPFQIKWNDNRDFKYCDIKNLVNSFVSCLQQPKPSWREEFISEIRNLE